jgi:hypothetical protein
MADIDVAQEAEAPVLRYSGKGILTILRASQGAAKQA